MDKKNTEDAIKTVDKLVDMIERGEFTSFNQQEGQALKEVARTWNQFKAVITLGSILGSSFKWFIMIAAAWVTFQSGFFDFIRNGLK